MADRMLTEANAHISAEGVVVALRNEDSILDLLR